MTTHMLPKNYKLHLNILKALILLVSLSTCGANKEVGYLKDISRLSQENLSLKNDVITLEKELEKIKYLPQEEKQVFNDVVLIANEDFIISNFSDKCLLQVMSLSKDNRTIPKEIESIDDCFKLFVEINNQRIFYLYSKTGKEVLDKYKLVFTGSFYECDIASKFSSDNKRKSGNTSARNKFRIRNYLGLVEGKLNYCGSRGLVYKYMKNPSPGDYIQLSIIRDFDCNAFADCKFIKSIILTDYETSTGFRYQVLAKFDSNLLSSIRKCRGFKTIFKTKI